MGKLTMVPGDLCLVTGASGFLASWMAKELLENGYSVRGTVRSLGDSRKVDAIRKLLPDIELVEADLRSPTGWPEAVAGSAWVFHVASPQAVPDERDRTGGAVRGTDYLMRAALAAPTVKKIVVTSSEAAIAYGHPRDKQRFTEDDWTVVNRIPRSAGAGADYMHSKTLAEQLAWRLAGDPSVNLRGVPLSTVNPGFIAGPSLVPWGRYSLETLRQIAEGRMPIIPDMVTHIVDVRDCARMHVAVMGNVSADGRRHFCFAAEAKMVEMAKVIHANYTHLGIFPSTRVLPNGIAWLLKFVSKDIGWMYSKFGTPNVYEMKWPSTYQYVHTGFSDIIKASMDSMLEHGWIKAGRPAAKAKPGLCPANRSA